MIISVSVSGYWLVKQQFHYCSGCLLMTQLEENSFQVFLGAMEFG
jgi:hypothetical protein